MQKIAQIMLKHLKWWLLGVVSFSTIVLLLHWVTSQLRDPMMLPIRVVEVKGDFHYLDKAALHAELAPLATGGFFSVDVKALHRQARTTPWVENATVRRVWPDTLRIQIWEQQAKAQWQDSALMNEQGELFTPKPATFPPSLPVLSGMDEQIHAVWEQFFALSEFLLPRGLGIQQLTLAERGSWQLQLDNGVILMLGKQDLMARISRFLVLLADIPPERQIAYADLRYTNGIAIGWVNG